LLKQFDCEIVNIPHVDIIEEVKQRQRDNYSGRCLAQLIQTWLNDGPTDNRN